jgi:hypothetical protein
MMRSAHLTAWRGSNAPRSMLGPRASPESSGWVNQFSGLSEGRLMSDPGPTGPGFAVSIVLKPSTGSRNPYRKEHLEPT